MLIFRSILNGIPRKLEVWTSVFWEFRFASRINTSLFIRLCVALPILYLNLRILALKCTNFTFAGVTQVEGKSRLKLFPTDPSRKLVSSNQSCA